MRYSYEFKRKGVELYYQGCYPDTPKGVTQKSFRKKVKECIRIEKTNGPDALRHKGRNKICPPEDKLELVSKVIAGESCQSVAINAGINSGLLYQWVRKYKDLGYNELINKTKGRKPRNPDMKNEMYYGYEKDFKSFEEFSIAVEEYIYYYTAAPTGLPVGF